MRCKIINNIGHGIYDVEFDRIHYRSLSCPIIPNKFYHLLKTKGEKWYKQYKTPLIPFTIGVVVPTGLRIQDKLYAIAIVHPWDTSNKRIGENIVSGRINRELCHIEKRDSYTKRTADSKILADLETDPKLKAKILIPFPDYIISPFYCGE